MIKIPTTKERFGTKLKLLILFSVFSLFTFNTRAQVSLTATGGTASGTFTTLNAAFTAINAGTHQGVINIVISANTTEPAIAVPLLKSGSPSNYTSITIKPSGNVTVNGNATATASRGMIELNGADNVTIDGDDPLTSGTRNLTFLRPTSTTTGLAVIRLASTSTTGADGANNNTIKNCIITGSRSSATVTTVSYGINMSNSSSITTGAYSSLNTIIDNNLITRCYHGVFANGASATYPNTGIEIKNNTIGNATSANNVGFRGILLTYSAVSSGGALIQNNDIRVGDYGSTGYSTTIAGIELGTVNFGVQVIGNNIHDINQPSTGGYGAHGIYITGSTNMTSSTIANNFIRDCKMVVYQSSATSAFIPTGVFFTAGATNVNFVNNTIVMNAQLGSGVNFSSFCVNSSVSGVTFAKFMNNILVNNATSTSAYGFYCSATGNISGGAVNNNCYYVPNGNVGYYNGALRNTISDWKTATSKDGSSLSYNVPFVSSTDLHINNATAIPLESGGQSTAVSGITTDFDGDARPGPVGSVNGGGTGPDLGADEFDGIPADVVPPTISYTALTNTCSTSSRTLTATISDGGSGVPTSGGDLPILYYQINSGTLTPSQGVYLSANNFEFTLGSGVSATDTVKYFIVAQDVDGNVACFPSSGAGSFTTSPPAAGTPPTTLSSYIIGVSLSGTYTVGSGGNYATLTAAAGSFNGNCLAGPVIFSLTDATYSTSETFPITFNSNGYSSLTNTLTIVPATGVTSTITGSVSSPLIILNGADFITIDGSNNATSSRNLTILNSATATPSVIQMISQGTGAGATNNTIKNCILRTGINSTLGYGIAIGGSTIGTAGSDNDSITIQNNLIDEAAIGIYAIGNAANSTLGIDFLQISQNTITSNGTLSGPMAMRIGNAVSANINQNTISIETTGASLCGISLETGFINSIVSRNLISKVKTTNASSIPVVRGIAISTGEVNSNVKIENNVISNVISFYATTNLGSNPVGILIGASGIATTYTNICGGINLDFNTVNLYGSVNRNSTTINSALFIGSNATTLNIRNNIFANSISNVNATGTASKSYAIYCQSALTAFSTINYNDYFVSGTQGVLGFLTADAANLSALQTAFGQNVNSLNSNPDFNSNTNLTPNLGSPVIAAGTPIGSILVDYLGSSRSATNPSMGGYENGADGVGPLITYTALPTQCSVAGANLTASVYDFSGVPNTGTDVPTLYWKAGINGTYASVQGTYTSGTNFDFTFGAGVTTSDTVYYYVVAQDSLNNVSISPSTGAASLTASPPAAGTAPTTPSSYIIGNLLTGTIPVGTGGTYTTLTAAAAAYNNGCISGAVVFSLTDVLYSTAETFPITFNANGYASLTDYLTIKPAASINTVIEGSVATGSIIRLDGADFITIDGSNSGTNSRNLTIRNNTLTTSGNAVVWIAAPALGNGSRNNTLKNTIIEGNAASTSFFGMYVGGSATITLTAAGSERNDNNLISNNLFRKTQYGLVMFGYAANQPDSNNRVMNNLFGTGVAGEGFNLEAVRTDRQKNMIISGNDVQNIRSTSTTALYGLRLLDFKDGLCYNNKIHNIAYTGSSTGQANGLLVLSSTYTTVGNPSNAYIFNNSVYDITSTSTSTTWALTGIIASTGYNDHYYYNSVSLTGQLNNSSSGLSAAFALGN
ncbi:MAG: beta strand repeat-containing protein, partial [Dolichospermum sp.]